MADIPYSGFVPKCFEFTGSNRYDLVKQLTRALIFAGWTFVRPVYATVTWSATGTPADGDIEHPQGLSQDSKYRWTTLAGDEPSLHVSGYFTMVTAGLATGQQVAQKFVDDVITGNPDFQVLSGPTAGVVLVAWKLPGALGNTTSLTIDYATITPHTFLTNNGMLSGGGYVLESAAHPQTGKKWRLYIYDPIGQSKTFFDPATSNNAIGIAWLNRAEDVALVNSLGPYATPNLASANNSPQFPLRPPSRFRVIASPLQAFILTPFSVDEAWSFLQLAMMYIDEDTTGTITDLVLGITNGYSNVPGAIHSLGSWRSASHCVGSNYWLRSTVSGVDHTVQCNGFGEALQPGAPRLLVTQHGLAANRAWPANNFGAAPCFVGLNPTDKTQNWLHVGQFFDTCVGVTRMPLDRSFNFDSTKRGVSPVRSRWWHTLGDVSSGDGTLIAYMGDTPQPLDVDAYTADHGDPLAAFP